MLYFGGRDTNYCLRRHQYFDGANRATGVYVLLYAPEGLDACLVRPTARVSPGVGLCEVYRPVGDVAGVDVLPGMLTQEGALSEH